MSFQELKLGIIAATGLSKDALHIYVGLIVLLAVAAALRKPLRSPVPWLAVVAAAAAGELIDLRDNLVTSGVWEWRASVHDVLNTVFWPTMLLLLARFGALRAGESR